MTTVKFFVKLQSTHHSMKSSIMCECVILIFKFHKKKKNHYNTAVTPDCYISCAYQLNTRTRNTHNT